MKALNLQRKNQILFGFLVITLAMSKSWFETAERGQLDLAQKSGETIEKFTDRTEIEDGKEKIGVEIEIETRTVKGPSSSKLVDGKRETTEGAERRETQGTIKLQNGCASCVTTVVIPQGSVDYIELAKNEAKKIIAKRKREEAVEKANEKKKAECQLVEVDGEFKDVRKLNFKEVEQAEAYITCLDTNDKLTLSKVRGRLTNNIYALLESENEEDQEKARDLIDLLDSTGAGDKSFYDYLKGLKHHDLIFRQSRILAERKQYNALNNLVSCMDPNFEQQRSSTGMPNSRNVPSQPGYFSCAGMGFIGARNEGHYEAMQDGYKSLNAYACRITTETLRVVTSSCNASSPYQNLADGIANLPVDASGNSAVSGTAWARAADGSLMAIPAVGARQVGANGNYNYDTRYDINALTGRPGVVYQPGTMTPIQQQGQLGAPMVGTRQNPTLNGQPYRPRNY